MNIDLIKKYEDIIDEIIKYLHSQKNEIGEYFAVTEHYHGEGKYMQGNMQVRFQIDDHIAEVKIWKD